LIQKRMLDYINKRYYLYKFSNDMFQFFQDQETVGSLKGRVRVRSHEVAST